MTNKLVFISHITEEADLAKIIAEEIKASFLGLLDTFVSSDGESLPAGGRWLDNIDEALSRSAIQISLCSPKSITRPWINFEAGASWIRRIPVVPLCHSGLKKSQLPIPMAMLQGADLDSVSDLRTVFSELAKTLGAARVPDVDYEKIVSRSQEFVTTYTYLNNIREAIFRVCHGDSILLDFFFSGKTQSIPIKVRDYLVSSILPALEELKNFGLLTVTPGSVTVGSEGMTRHLNLTLNDRYFKEVLPLIQ